ncbi:MAG: type IX secretion system sortase PorU [Candidatus Zixiibacteriota bacterium]
MINSTEQGFRFVYDFGPALDAAEAASSEVAASELVETVQLAVPPGSEARLLSATGIGESLSDVVAPDSSYRMSGLAEVSRPVLTRGRQTVGVRISPYTNGLTYRQVEVEVGFDRTRAAAALSREEDPVFERIWASSLANYDVARSWPREDRKLTAISAAMSTDSHENLTAASAWYKIPVTQTGLVRVTGAQLEAAGISLSGLRSDSIRIFNAGGLPNSVDNFEPRPEFTEISLMVLDGGDGEFGRNDQLLFFGEAPNRWLYSPTGTPRWVNNVYTTTNIYWLAVSGSFSTAPRRMVQVLGAPTGAPVYDTYRARVHIEQDNLIGTEPDGNVWDFYNWYWSNQTSVAFQVATPGAIESDSTHIYVSGRTNRNIDVTVNGVPASEIDCNSSECRFYTRALRGGAAQSNQTSLVLTPISARIPPFLDYVEMTYSSRIVPANNRLDFVMEGIDGDVDIRVVDAFSSTPTILDISDPLHPEIIAGYDRSGGYVTFRGHVSTDSANRFYCGIVSLAVPSAPLARVDFTDLRAGYKQTDLIIVATSSLAGSLDEYIAYRQGQGVVIQVVDIADIIDNFSYGLYDPTAIRDFLKFAYENYSAPAPSGVLFVGDATYDYLDRLGTGTTNLVPSYVRPGDRTYSDDNYVYFGEFGILDEDRDRGYDMMTARWPVRSASEINTIVAKAREYESPATFGAWRTRITLVADDEHAAERHNELFHTRDTETLERVYVPRTLNRQKIYLWDYPFVNREKPGANEAILRAFNEGTLIVNYVGHGNPDVWAHERVLQRAGDLPLLRNSGRLPLVYAASCDIGFFDDPQSEGMGEGFLEMREGGAVGVISATRLVYAADNAQFNRAVYAQLFANPDLSISEALFAAKVQRQYPNPFDTIPRRVDNDRAYSFLGDPCLRLGLPRYRIEFTTQPDSLVALQTSRLSGRITDQSGLPFNGDGVLYVDVYDSDRQRSYHLPDDTNMTRYAVTGPTIFRGTASIDDGQFDMQFITPVDVGYRGVSARVSVYAVLGSVDAVGMVDSIAVSERQGTAQDMQGPQIEYGSVKRGLIRDGDFIDRADSLVIRLADVSGINLVGGIGHGISLVIDDRAEEAIYLTDLFQYERDSHTSGSLMFALSGFESGRHRFNIKAWDNVNNVSSAEFTAEIGGGAGLAVRDLLNHPNPMQQLTIFYFELTEAVEELKVSVYTLSGKYIWSTSRYDLQADRYPNETVEIVWDGRDNEGDRVGTGVYIYRLSALSAGQGGEAEEFGKLVVLN